MKVDEKVRLLEENELLKEEKQVLMARIEAEQGNLSQYHDRQAAANAEKSKVEEQLADTQAQLKAQEKESKAAQSSSGGSGRPKSSSSSRRFISPSREQRSRRR